MKGITKKVGALLIGFSLLGIGVAQAATYTYFYETSVSQSTGYKYPLFAQDTTTVVRGTSYNNTTLSSTNHTYRVILQNGDTNIDYPTGSLVADGTSKTVNLGKIGTGIYNVYVQKLYPSNTSNTQYYVKGSGRIEQ